ncbi:unnamed protein product [Porites lobata]|uniref:Uncharacterized protein n=1 Tax=Porites lobata TaxID=104759 RepID=A0ABN8PVR6_9CNID|nr:unnamed protein product [Porites lobata]
MAAEESEIVSASEVSNVSNTEESLLEKIQAKFGEEIKTAFEKEEIIDDASIEDLTQREPDAPIFSRLGLTYGKAVKFRKEFGRHVNSLQSRPSSPQVKPTMAAIAGFSPEMKRLYLAKRKQVGVLASEHWKHKLPKFNTPEKKAELEQFAKKISDECSLPEAGFFTDGIAQHIKSFFSEQRRFHKSKKVFGFMLIYVILPSCSESSSNSEVELTPPPKLPSMDDDDNHSEGSTDTMIVNEEEEASGESAEPDIKDNKMSKKSAMVIIKAVTEKIPDREELVKLLKGRFQVTQKSLTTLSVTQLLEVTARKLIKFKYVSLKLGVGLADIKRADITVNREIAL